MTHIHPFPHRYIVSSECHRSGAVTTHSDQLESIACEPPVQFGGPGDHWSPETLLLAALSSCFSLTFRAIATHRRLQWLQLDVRVEGVLEREQGNSRFTQFRVRAELQLPSDGVREAAHDALVRAKEGCLISSSLSGTIELDVSIR